MHANKLSLALAAVVLLAACGPSEYSYAPVHTTGAELTSARGASYPIPPEHPRGSARITVLGVDALAPGATIADDTLTALHVVLQVDNRSDEPWLVVGGEQYIELKGAPVLVGERVIRRSTWFERFLSGPPFDDGAPSAISGLAP